MVLFCNGNGKIIRKLFSIKNQWQASSLSEQSATGEYYNGAPFFSHPKIQLNHCRARLTKIYKIAFFLIILLLLPQCQSWHCGNNSINVYQILFPILSGLLPQRRQIFSMMIGLPNVSIFCRPSFLVYIS